MEEILKRINAAGGLYWPEDEPDPDWLQELLRKGYVRRDEQSAWSTTRGVRITKSGLKRIGMG
jgi:hypothetical protein